MWSGGLDSTALIWDYLTRGYEVRAGYVAFRNNTWQTACELQSIDRMLPFLEKHRFKFTGVIGWFKWNYAENIGLRRAHCIVLASFLAMLNEPFDEMAIAVVRDDRVAKADISAIQSVFKSMRPLMENDNKLAFPLLRASKRQLFDSLPLELAQRIWTCNNPKKRRRHQPCGRCDRCKAYAELYRGGGVKRIY